LCPDYLTVFFYITKFTSNFNLCHSSRKIFSTLFSASLVQSKKGANAPSFYQRVKGQKGKRVLIPEAAHRETSSQIAAEAVGIAAIVIQEEVPGECYIVL
jgi:hypothetical protein